MPHGKRSELAFARLHQRLAQLLPEDLAAERIKFGLLLVEIGVVLGGDPLDLRAGVIEYPLDWRRRRG